VFAFLILFILLLVYHQPLSWSAFLYFPLAISITLLSSLGIGFMLSALNVKYRDFRYLLPFLIQLLFFGGQIFYSLDHLAKVWVKNLFYIFPFNGAVELFRYPIDSSQFYLTGVYISCASMFFFLFIGLTIFKKSDSFFADLI
jgi:lipopolysaccharide transport system permease protein